MDGITATVVGALVGAVVVIASKSILDAITTTLIAIATIFALLYTEKIQESYIITAAAVVGVVIKLIL